MSLISHVKSKGNIIEDTQRVMQLAKWENYITGNNIVLKVNYMSDQVIPGLCTSPWVLEGVLKELSKMNSSITLVDSDLATNSQLKNAIRNWGVLDLCSKYGARFVNLSTEKTRVVQTSIPNKIKEIEIPEILLEADSILSLPVAKTHYLTKLTCSLKNQWGTIPKIRQQYHTIADYLIPEINLILGVKFAIVDATICIEGNGPRTGIPKVVNSIFASNDLVSLDKCVQDLMEIKEEVGHILNSYTMINGSSLDYNILGDELTIDPFIPSKTTIITETELFFRKIPAIRHLLFKTPLFRIPAWIATKYNSWWYYKKKGKEFQETFLENHPEYREEFENLIKNS